MGIFDRFRSKKNGKAAIHEDEQAEINTTEAEASLVVKAWGELDAETLRPILSEDFTYTSVAVSEPMHGADNYMHYLAGKFETYRNMGITYNPVVADGPDSNSKIVILNGNTETAEEDAPILIVNFSNSKIASMLMRPRVMFSMQHLNDTVKANQIMDKACNAIHNWVEGEVLRLGFDSDDFGWIQYNPILDAPAFQHMCFRLGKSVFSLVIYLQGQFHSEESDLVVMMPNVMTENQLRECKDNDLMACSIFLDINSLAIPTLCFTDKDELVDLAKTALSGSGIMSKWEINASAINQVLNYILKSGVDQLSYTNVLTFYPQIYYYKEGQKYFAYVEGHPIGIGASPIELNLVENASQGGCIGKFADVGMSFIKGNNGDFNDKVLPRCNSIVSNFKELIPIEEAITGLGTKV